MRYNFRFLLLLFCVVLFTTANAGNYKNFGDTTRKVQAVYALNFENEVKLFAPSLLFLGSDLFYKPIPLTTSDLSALSVTNIPTFEQSVVYFDSLDAAHADVMSDLINYVSFGISGLVILSTLPDKTIFFTNGVIYAEGALLTLGITEVLKSTVSRIRPYAYNTNYSDSYRLYKDESSSFPSGHTSSTAYNCFFAARLINDYYLDTDQRGLKIVTWGAAATVPLVVGYLRTAAGKHFYTDVVAGYLLGAGVGLLLPELHEMDNIDVVVAPNFNMGFKGANLLLTF